MTAIISPHFILDDFLHAWLSTSLLDCCQLEIRWFCLLSIQAVHTRRGLAACLYKKKDEFYSKVNYVNSSAAPVIFCQRPE